MPIAKTRARRIAAIAAGPLAVVIAGSLVWSASNAAFTSNTRNSGNAWSAGQVTLTDDDLGAAAFTVEQLTPGDTGSKCIVVTSNSNVAGEVRSYTENLSISGSDMSPHILLKIEQGTGGSFNDCTGFVPSPGALPAASLATLNTVNHDYATGGARWTTTGTPGETHSYRGTWTFDTTGMTQQEVDSLQSSRVSVDLVWELQSN
jgi:hypothetical protein